MPQWDAGNPLAGVEAGDSIRLPLLLIGLRLPLEQALQARAGDTEPARGFGAIATGRVERGVGGGLLDLCEPRREGQGPSARRRSLTAYELGERDGYGRGKQHRTLDRVQTHTAVPRPVVGQH